MDDDELRLIFSSNQNVGRSRDFRPRSNSTRGTRRNRSEPRRGALQPRGRGKSSINNLVERSISVFSDQRDMETLQEPDTVQGPRRFQSSNINHPKIHRPNQHGASVGISTNPFSDMEIQKPNTIRLTPHMFRTSNGNHREMHRRRQQRSSAVGISTNPLSDSSGMEVQEPNMTPGPSGFQTSNVLIDRREDYQRPHHRTNRSSATLKGGHPENPRNIKRNPLTTLQNITQSDDIIANVNHNKQFLFNLFKSPTYMLDIFVLTVEILAKTTESPFRDLSFKAIQHICNSLFITQLRSYLMDLPYQDEKTKAKNSLYWNQPSDFWKNLIKFLETIVNMSPSTAVKMGQPLLQNTIKLSLNDLHNKHNFILPEEQLIKIAELQKKMEAKEQQNQAQTNYCGHDNDEEPLEDFRLLPIIPDRYHLMREPFLRPNVTNGAYKNVDHYLDIQFRLLLEDCYGPLRKGLKQYMANPLQYKYDNIRVYKNVKLLGPYVSHSKVGCLIQIDKKSNKSFFKIKWKYSKRMLYGSLLLLSKDNFKHFIVATVIDRDIKYLAEGQLPIALVKNNEELHLADAYTVIESDVYFEPYLHVLKILRMQSFPINLTMQEYIVKATPTISPPEYLSDITSYVIQHKEFMVLMKETWPTKDELNLNNNQYEALQLALTNKMALIQGPPGTGKTYIGVKIAEIFLHNLNRQILVICYTNHALDQFLEYILDQTNSVVRIGGQSNNKTLEKYNIKNLRQTRATSLERKSAEVFYNEKQNLNIMVTQLKRLQEHIENLDNGVLSYDTLKILVPESEILERCYNTIEPLISWLFENMTYDENTEDEYEEAETENDEDYMKNERNELNIDDDILGDDIVKDDVDNIKLKLSFSLKSNMYTLEKLKSQIRSKRKTQENIALLELEAMKLNSSIAFFKTMKRHFQEHGIRKLDARNIKKMPAVDRWNIYFRWIDEIKLNYKEKFRKIQSEFIKEQEVYEDARMYYDLQFIKHTRVIGITTTGAARVHRMLKMLKPSIVIVEEAAEVLEQHIVATLGADCKHLILIGDHQQLRPSASYMKLAKNYNLEISLFERLIKNNIPNVQLNIQHRMRPEIASLIAPHIYPNLQNHPSVEEFPPVRGMINNLFFYTHDYPEESSDDSSSRSNTREADMALSLANYLMQQDYNPEDVTLLAAYSGQMFYMRKQRSLYSHLSKIKITVVDNYQGEESKIIILSLVRNNHDNKIGFLATENRVCVALSRAREGMYIFGNIDILKQNTDLWTKIAATLENNGSLGTEIRVHCENHPETINTISKPEDFNNVPEGGCLLKCNFQLSCKHYCPLICHGYNRLHESVICPEKCERIICELGHVCPLRCKEECKPCMVPIVKRLPCGHDMTLPCWEEANKDVKCMTVIPIQFPKCGHEGEKPCHLDINEAKCTMKCVYRVEKCGHACTRNCHVNDDPEHDKYVCTKPCARAKAKCSLTLVGDRGEHQCKKNCYESCDDCDVMIKKKRSTCTHVENVPCSTNVDDTPCPKKCRRTLPCGHHCPMKCFEECGNCTVKLTKVIPECGHTIELQCRESATQSKCTRKCKLTLPCGHECMGPCREPCAPTKCTALMTHEFDINCGHKTELSCNVLTEYIQSGRTKPELLLKHCSAPCTQTLECGHLCSGTCSECYQGRLHVSCKEICHKDNICGHRCEEPCNQLCPPCRKKCELKCAHSLCQKPCGAPCTPCKELCVRACPHSSCTNRCDEKCSRLPCDQPCPLLLPCDHPCRGLCGEVCPNVCADCRPDDVPRDFLGDEFDDDVKFIQLEDCAHVLSVEDMDNLMMGDSETINIRACPFCRKPIINTRRYKDLIMRMFSADINPIKEKVFGNKRVIGNKKQELMEQFQGISVKYEQLISENVHYQKALKHGMQFKKFLTLLDLNTKSIYLEILNTIGEYYMKAHKLNVTVFLNEILYLIEFVCTFLYCNNTHKISRQQQNDIGNELNRISFIIQLEATLKDLQSVKDHNDTKHALKSVVNAIVYEPIFDSNIISENIKKLIKAKEIILEERQMIVKVMDMKSGHWYKCPNGHFYCIGECGGAMEISKCMECGEQIGGQSHALLSSNKHAGEMDGSRFAAWSQEYNNMANFNLNDL